MSDLVRALLPALEAAERRVLRPGDLDTVIVHNAGPIPRRRRAASANGMGDPGFNVVVAERGRPVYFCKCRPSGHEPLSHEAAVGRALRVDPTTAPHVAPSHLERGDVMDVLAVRRLPGRPYHELVAKQTESEWPATVEHVVALVERMAASVTSAMPSLAQPAVVRLADEGRWALQALEAEQGLSLARVEALVGALARAGEVTARIQHGDLWPPNVLVDRRSFYILDLELFGRVRVPLYDLLHMLHICSEVRRSESDTARPWIERLVRGDPLEAGPRALIGRAARRYRLSDEASFGAVVYYIVDMAARVRARGAWSADWRAYLAQVSRLADLVAEGAAGPETLLKTDRR